MFGRSVYFCVMVIVGMNALPTMKKNQQQCTQEIPSAANCNSCNKFDDFLDDTKDMGLMAIYRVTETALNIGSVVGGFTNNILNTGVKHTREFVSTGRDVVVDNFEDVKRIGKEGIIFMDKVVSATGDYISNGFSKLPFAQFGSTDDCVVDMAAECMPKENTKSLWTMFNF